MPSALHEISKRSSTLPGRENCIIFKAHAKYGIASKAIDVFRCIDAHLRSPLKLGWKLKNYFKKGPSGI